MSDVLVVGNAIKDVYLQFDKHQENFELDDKNIPWLNLGFNGSGHKFFQRTSIASGTAVTTEVFDKLGVKYSHNKNEPDYRYILCNSGNIAYFAPSARAKTIWNTPDAEPKWIFVDRSANISEGLAESILAYLSKHNVKLAIYAPKQENSAAEKLIEKADLVFAEKTASDFKTRGEICRVDISGWKTTRTDLMTHLTVYSIVAATVLAAKIKKYPTEQAMLMAKANVENATLGETVPLSKILQIISDEKRDKFDLEIMAKTYKTAKNKAEIPVVKIAADAKNLEKKLRNEYAMDMRFAELKLDFKDKKIEDFCEILANGAAICQKTKIVPIVKIDITKEDNETKLSILNTLNKKFAEKQVEIDSCILQIFKD